jgi:2-iminobutanoate/2-iminopropanoate deaminase
MFKTEIKAKNAPSAIGPYSQAVEIDGFIYCSGQIGVNPKTGEIVKGGIKEQTKQIFENLTKILIAAGAGADDVVKITVFMTDLSEFKEMNDLYSTYFKKPYPARSTVQVVKLPKGVKIEVEAIAYAK